MRCGSRTRPVRFDLPCNIHFYTRTFKEIHHRTAWLYIAAQKVDPAFAFIGAKCDQHFHFGAIGPHTFDTARSAHVADSFAALANASWAGALVSDLTNTVRSTADLLEAIRIIVPDADVSAARVERSGPPGGFDTKALKTVIGDWHKVSLTEGVRRTVELYRQIAAREPA